MDYDDEVIVRVIEVSDKTVTAKVVKGKGLGAEIKIEVFLSEDESSHNIEVDDVATIKLRMAN